MASGGYQSDSKLTSLESVLERGVLDLRANHPDVAKAWEARAKHRLGALDQDQKELIVRKTIELVAVSGERLGRELELDAKTVARGTDGAAQSGALRRFAARVGKMRWIARAQEVVQKIDASSGYKGTRILQTLNSIIEIVISIFT